MQKVARETSRSWFAPSLVGNVKNFGIHSFIDGQPQKGFK